MKKYSMVSIKALNNLLGRELGKCKMWERAFFFPLGQPQKYSSPQVPAEKKNLYLLTEWEGQTENIWVEVMTYGPSAATSARHDRVPNVLPSGSNKLSP